MRNIRQGYLWCGLLPMMALLFAYFYLEKYLGIQPCTLCLMQRVAWLIVLTATIFMYYHPIKRWLWHWLTVFGLSFGLLFSIRQIWLQYHTSGHLGGSCLMPGFFLSWHKISNAMVGLDTCHELTWTLFGWPMSVWSTAAYLVYAAIWGVLYLRD
jgi:disulfide bond formation protein DsbB